MAQDQMNHLSFAIYYSEKLDQTALCLKVSEQGCAQLKQTLEAMISEGDYSKNIVITMEGDYSVPPKHPS